MLGDVRLSPTSGRHARTTRRPTPPAGVPDVERHLSGYLDALDRLLPSPKESEANEGQVSAADDILKCAKRNFTGEEALQRVCYTGPNALSMSRTVIFPRPEDMYVTVDGRQVKAPAGGMPQGATTIADIGEGNKGGAVSNKAARDIRKKCRLNEAADLGIVAVMSKTDQSFFTALATKANTLDFAQSWPAPAREQGYIPTFRAAWKGLFDGLDMQRRSRDMTIRYELFDDLTETERLVNLWDTLKAYHKKSLQTHSSGTQADSGAIDQEARDLLVKAKQMKQVAVIERYAREIMYLYDHEPNRSKIHADIYVSVNTLSKNEAKTFKRMQAERMKEEGSTSLSAAAGSFKRGAPRHHAERDTIREHAGRRSARARRVCREARRLRRCRRERHEGGVRGGTG